MVSIVIMTNFHARKIARRNNLGELRVNTLLDNLINFLSSEIDWVLFIYGATVFLPVVLGLIIGSISKGWMGEKRTAFHLWWSLSKKKYKVYHDLILPSSNGTSQIDHLVVSEFGIFIVETKNKKGWIYGDEADGYWTQNIYGKKFSFQNPLRQTYRQMKVLCEFLGIPDDYVMPIIYFNGDSRFRTELPENVIQYGPGHFIKMYKDKVFERERLERINSKLNDHLKTSKLTNTDHLISLDERHNSDDRCPRCGGQLVLRVAGRGKRAGREFMGCSSFPRCRFTINL